MVVRMQQAIVDKLAAIPGVSAVGLIDDHPDDRSTAGTIRSPRKTTSTRRTQVPPIRAVQVHLARADRRRWAIA